MHKTLNNKKRLYKKHAGLYTILTLLIFVIIALLLLKFCCPVNRPTPIKPVDPVIDPIPEEPKEYTVTFYGKNGSVLLSQKVKEGEIPSFDGVVQAVVEGSTLYSFDKWDKEIKPVTEDTDYFATYKSFYIHSDPVIVVTPSVEYFYIENTNSSSSNIKLVKEGSPYTISLEYSEDGGVSWNDFSTDSDYPVAGNSKFYIRSKSEDVNAFSIDFTNYYYFEFDNPGSFSVGGDVTTLLTKNGNVDDLTMSLPLGSLDYCFNTLFWGCQSLTSINDLKLTSTKLSPYCYCGMFGDCGYSVVPAGFLPATDLNEECYTDMFRDTPSLTTVNCTINDPDLTGAIYCCNLMFYGDTNLVNVNPNFLSIPMTLEDHCYTNIFCNCTSLATAPILPATNLVEYCYAEMFYGCSALTSITVGFSDITYFDEILDSSSGTPTMVNHYLSGWVSGVSTMGGTLTWKGSTTDTATLNGRTGSINTYPSTWVVISD